MLANNIRSELERLLNKDVGNEAYVFGTGHTSQLYTKAFERSDKIKIKGYCASNPQNPNFNGYTLFSVNELLEQIHCPTIFVCSWQKEVFAQVREIFKNGKVIGIDDAVFSLYRSDVLDAYDLMTDESKETFAHIIKCRMDYKMPNVLYTHGHSYFSIPQARRYGNEVFVTCGAYVGDTLEQYIWRKPSFKKIIAFEPDKRNYEALKKRVCRLVDEWAIPLDKIVIENMGVGKKSNNYCVQGSGIGSMLSNDGEYEVKVRSLDDYLDERVDFIAADVEGFEYDMLLGAEKTIKNYKPLLAISIYHNAMDMFQIPLLIKRMIPEYKFAVRHNTVTYDDTILYAYTSSCEGWIQ